MELVSTWCSPSKKIRICLRILNTWIPRTTIYLFSVNLEAMEKKLKEKDLKYMKRTLEGEDGSNFLR
ncbi:hypothetical protein D0Y65_033022 [Glycine soja]|uniref:Uncharacterized protein n=1 Tax=Glycine soja TaxID=3848 RepID=A0A445HJ21_GLYSO|nr:hypothetical protein D0Y65_033022 [Glycine soja]